MLQNILDWCQPFTIVVFIISGVVSLKLGYMTQGAINLCFAVANFFIFYGVRVLGR